MKTAILIIAVVFANISVLAQNDAQAKSILEKVSSKNNGYKTIRSDFKYTLTSLQETKSHVENGKILMKSDKYHLILAASDITFDGKSIYTYLKESNEINITKPEPSKEENGDFFFSNPRDLFKIKNDFKSKLIKETNVGTSLCYEIDLYPINLKTNYSRIRMHIDKNSFQIVDTKLFLKDGTQHLIEFSNFKANIDIADSEFVFDQKKHPRSEVNDMRF
jgi:outer membrane lipoprotein carrier protein